MLSIEARGNRVVETRTPRILTKLINFKYSLNVLDELCSQHSFYPSSAELKDRGLDQGILGRSTESQLSVGLFKMLLLCWQSPDETEL